MNAKREPSNQEIFLWALYRCGGASHFVDVEDVFEKCFELAPERFSWRTREIPDSNRAAHALRDAEAKYVGLLLKTADGLKRRLTVEGQKWIETRRTRFLDALESSRLVREPRTRPKARLLASVECSNLFRAWQSADEVPSKKWQMAELLRCSPDSNVEIWRNRIQALRSAAYDSQQKDILRFLDETMKVNPEWF